MTGGMRRLLMVGGCLFLLCGCASHRSQPDDDLAMDEADNGPPPGDGQHGGGRGGGQGIWSDVLHTAMQAGMGLIHH